MERRMFAASVLSAALGMATLGAGIAVAQPMSGGMTQQQMMQMRQNNMKRMAADHLEKCYGVNAIGRNDCAAGAHSCAGQATRVDDPASFVLLPAGDCAKIAGGKLSPS
ncbi:MAG: DUF2282 domain-containing protein [Rhodospirillales bacterium]|nr:DUF2282 domain-containing protein [Rhodospirillales bacterium]